MGELAVPRRDRPLAMQNRRLGCGTSRWRDDQADGEVYSPIGPVTLLGCGRPEPSGEDMVAGEVGSEQREKAAKQSRPGAKEVLGDTSAEVAKHDRLELA